MHKYQDELLEKFAATGTFDEEEITEFRRSTKPLIVRLSVYHTKLVQYNFNYLKEFFFFFLNMSSMAVLSIKFWV